MCVCMYVYIYLCLCISIIYYIYTYYICIFLIRIVVEFQVFVASLYEKAKQDSFFLCCQFYAS